METSANRCLKRRGITLKQFFINNEDVKTRISEWGNKENPTIICIHGLGSSSLSFLELAEFLKDKYHIFSIDLPGHGKSPAFNKDEYYEIPNLIVWISKVIEIIEKDNFYLMAHSWGGCIALHYSALYPEKVKKILLLDGGYHIKQFEYDYFVNANKEQLDFKHNYCLDEEIQSYESDFDGYIFSSWNDFLDVERNNYLRWSELLERAVKDLMKEDDGKIIFCASGDTARGAIKSMYNSPTNLLYDKLRLPILLLQATLPSSWDEVRTLETEKFKEATNGIVKKIEGTTHLLHWDKPNLIVEEVLSWMK